MNMHEEMEALYFSSYVLISAMQVSEMGVI